MGQMTVFFGWPGDVESLGSYSPWACRPVGGSTGRSPCCLVCYSIFLETKKNIYILHDFFIVHSNIKKNTIFYA